MADRLAWPDDGVPHLQIDDVTSLDKFRSLALRKLVEQGISGNESFALEGFAAGVNVEPRHDKIQ